MHAGTAATAFELFSADLDMHENNISNFFGSNCAAGEAVERIWANGSYACETVGTDLQSVLQQGNVTGGQGIILNGSSILGFTDSIRIGNGTLQTADWKDVAIGMEATSAPVSGVGTALGYRANASQDYTTAVGAFAADDNMGTYTTATGFQAVQNSSAFGVTGVGYRAAQSNSKYGATAFGYRAASENVGFGTTAVGHDAGFKNSGAHLTAVGLFAGDRNTGDDVTALGRRAGHENAAPSLTAVGHRAADETNTGSSVTVIGHRAGFSNDGDSLTALGVAAGEKNSGQNVTLIGKDAGFENKANNTVAIGAKAQTLSTGAVAIGYDARAPNTYETTLGNLRGQGQDLNVTGNMTVHGGTTVSEAMTLAANTSNLPVCDTEHVGQLRRNSADNGLYYCNGTIDWETIS